MRATINPITRTLAALAIGAAALASTGCVSRAFNRYAEGIGQAAKSFEGRSVSPDDPMWLGKYIKDCAINRGVPVIEGQGEYNKLVLRSHELPIALLTYTRCNEDAADVVLNFCAYKTGITIEKGVIADDAVELEGIVGKVLKSGQNVIILDQGNQYGCKLEDLPAWVDAYLLRKEKESARR